MEDYRQQQEQQRTESIEASNLNMRKAAAGDLEPDYVRREDARVDQIATALSKAQSEFQPVIKNKTVRVQTRTGGSYTFDYADLDAVISSVIGGLGKNGICYTFTVGCDALTLRLIHSSGQQLYSSVAITNPGMIKKQEGRDGEIIDKVQDIKEFGGELTYLKRYLLSAMLGVATEEDNDGSRANGDQSEYVEKQVKWLNLEKINKKLLDKIKVRVSEVGADQTTRELRTKGYAVSKQTQEEIGRMS